MYACVFFLSACSVTLVCELVHELTGLVNTACSWREASVSYGDELNTITRFWGDRGLYGTYLLITRLTAQMRMRHMIQLAENELALFPLGLSAI